MLSLCAVLSCLAALFSGPQEQGFETSLWTMDRLPAFGEQPNLMSSGCAIVELMEDFVESVHHVCAYDRFIRKARPPAFFCHVHTDGVAAAHYHARFVLLHDPACRFQSLIQNYGTDGLIGLAHSLTKAFSFSYFSYLVTISFSKCMYTTVV